MDKTRPDRKSSSIALSVVIPVYNEIEAVKHLHEELTAVLESEGVPYEIIYANDGSRDGSDRALAEIQTQSSRVVVINLRRNFGQTAAIAAGISQASGDVFVLLDADMQNDPADIRMMLDKLEEGYDVVSGWRRDRKDVFLTRRLPSMTANALISYVTGVRLHDYGCTLKAYRREVLTDVRLYGEMHRFIPVFAAASGARIVEIVVNHRPRIYGRSKYGLGRRTFKVLLDLVTVKFMLSNRTTPMYLFGGLGLALMASGLLTLFAAILNKLVNHIDLILTPLPQLAATLFTMGIQSTLLGLLAELLMRTYYEAQDKTPYIIRSILKSDRQGAPEPAQNNSRK